MSGVFAFVGYTAPWTSEAHTLFSLKSVIRFRQHWEEISKGGHAKKKSCILSRNVRCFLTSPYSTFSWQQFIIHWKNIKILNQNEKEVISNGGTLSPPLKVISAKKLFFILFLPMEEVLDINRQIERWIDGRALYINHFYINFYSHACPPPFPRLRLNEGPRCYSCSYAF